MCPKIRFFQLIILKASSKAKQPGINAVPWLGAESCLS